MGRYDGAHARSVRPFVDRTLDYPTGRVPWTMSGEYYGWRGRIGLLVPDINTVTEVEFNRHKPEGVSMHAARMTVEDPVDAASMERMNEDIDGAADAVAKTDPDVIAYCVTAGSFYRGKGYDVELEDAIEDRTGIPAVTTAAAVRRAFDHLGIESIVAVTPYVNELNDRLVEFFEAYGYSVLDVLGEQFETGDRYGTSTPQRVYDRATSIDVPAADGVFISGMEYHGLPVVEHLEADLEKPVVSAHQATLWNALDLATVGAEDVRIGRLFGDP